MIIQSLQTILHLNRKNLSTITYSKYFLYKLSTRLQSMYNHMVGPAASVVSSFYFIHLDGGSLENTLTVPVRMSQKSCQISVSFVHYEWEYSLIFSKFDLNFSPNMIICIVGVRHFLKFNRKKLYSTLTGILKYVYKMHFSQK